MRITKSRLYRRLAILSVAGALFAVSTTVYAAWTVGSRLTRIHTHRTMALPGVTLPPGEYTFEIFNSGSSGDAVLVSSNHQRKAHFLGLTRIVERPRNLPENQVIAVGEAPAGEPVPIKVWYPAGSASGRQFIY